MVSYLAYRTCALCSYGTGEAVWTSLCRAVLNLEDGTVVLSKETEISSTSFCLDFRIPGSPIINQVQIRLRQGRLRNISMTAYLVHSVCLQTLQEMLQKRVLPGHLLMVCQALNYEYEERSKNVDKDALFDPTTPLVRVTHPLDFLECHGNTVNQTRIDRLPTDILWMILSFLDSKSLLAYFNSSQCAIFQASVFPSWSRLLMYTKSLSNDRMSAIVQSIYRWFDYSDYCQLEELLYWIDDLEHLAQTLKARLYTSSLSANSSILSSSDSCPVGYQKFTSVVSRHLKGFTVYTTVIRGNRYISGLEGIPHTACKLLGNSRGIPLYVYFHTSTVNQLSFVIDSLGILSLRFGESVWTSGAPVELQNFEGLSIADGNCDRVLVVLADVLKFRRICWQRCSEAAKSFPESIIMKPRLIGTLLQEHFLSGPMEQMPMTNLFDTIPTESILFDESTTGISVYTSHFGYIAGICVYSKDHRQLAGDTSGAEDFFPLQGPEERISRLILRQELSSGDFSLIIETSLKRRRLFGPIETSDATYTHYTLQPRPGELIYGCFLHFGSPDRLESLGIVCIPETISAPFHKRKSSNDVEKGGEGGCQRV